MSRPYLSEQIRKFEIQWYLKNGKYPKQRITNIGGEPYMIGDWSWNRNHPDKPEHVESRIQGDFCYPTTKGDEK